MTDHPAAPAKSPLRREALALAIILAAVSGLAFALAWPWRPRAAPGGPTLARYVPLRNGGATLRAAYDAAGAPVSWESQNAVMIPSLDTVTDVREAPRAVIDRFHPWPEESGEEPDREIIEVRLRTLDTAGHLTETVSLILREPRGDFLVSLYDPASDRDLVFDPPLQNLSANLEPGEAWESAGRLSGELDYRATGRVLEKGPFANQARSFTDCLQVEMRLVLSREGETASDTRWHDWYCAGTGLVESQTFDTGGALTARSVTVSAEGILPGSAVLPPPANRMVSEDAPADPDSWQLIRFARALPAGKRGSSTIPPTWIPSDPPLLLTASYYNGDLVALDATGTVRWRFRSEGTIYGQPSFDAGRGRIYFGATDKRLYALDVRGLFLWSFQTGDSIATRPLVAGDTLVFGSEDRAVYALDADSSALRWRVVTGSAVVSSPALVGDLVITGNDDGGVYALDLQTGERRWLYARDAAIVAPVVVADSTLYIASRDGTLTAFAPANGIVHWAATIGQPLRTAPAVGKDAVFIVDSTGTITALDRVTGAQRWAALDVGYTGPPVLVDETLVVARNDGKIVRFGLDGKEQGRWDASDVGLPGDAFPAFYLGPALGDGAIWLADDDSVVYRLGGE
ncbi:MAG: PQQ-binding-like beta-propeller repeat protein [Anaerolineae bacterium]|nr:PQQ-binding-like beta-propeller repeat protein [Anaerolineae bacterium]